MTWLCDNGHVASARELYAAGATRRQLQAAVAAGRLMRVRTGTYACSHLDEQQLRAGRAGGLIDCVSALARHEDVWSGGRSDVLHVRLRPHGHAGPGGIVTHWRETFARPMHPFEVAPVDALLQAMSCLNPYNALAAVESSLHLDYLAGAELAALIHLAPERMRATLRRLNRLAQSGLETIARLQLEDAGHYVECQVVIPGAGPVDLLVDGCVGVETDGQKWHEGRFIEDRTKDIRVVSWGIPVLRWGKTHVLERWPETLFGLEQLLAQQRRRA